MYCMYVPVYMYVCESGGKKIHNSTKNMLLRKVNLKFWVGSQFGVLNVGEWYGGWVRGVGGGVGIFREISENFRGNFAEISGKMFGDPKTGNSYCETAK